MSWQIGFGEIKKVVKRSKKILESELLQKVENAIVG